jgi:hypothetical protein
VRLEPSNSAANQKAAPRARRPRGENPRNGPVPPLDATTSQPPAPPQSPNEDVQDQQPLDPEPLVHEPHHPARHPFAEKNG